MPALDAWAKPILIVAFLASDGQSVRSKKRPQCMMQNGKKQYTPQEKQGREEKNGPSRQKGDYERPYKAKGQAASQRLANSGKRMDVDFHRLRLAFVNDAHSAREVGKHRLGRRLPHFRSDKMCEIHPERK